MIPHPPQLDAALGAVAFEPLCIATFYDPAGRVVHVAPPTDGMLTHTSTQWPRDTLEATVPVALTPAATVPPVTPYGGRVALQFGARIGGTDYLFPRCLLAVTETSIIRPDNVIRLKAASLEARVNEDRYWSRDATPAGNASAVVAGIVRRTLGAGWLVRSTLTTDVALAAGAFPLDGDVWPTVEAIMDATGGEAVFEPDGTLWMRDDPVKSSPILTLRTGETQPGQITGYESVRGWAFNSVAVVYEEATGATPGRVVGLWQDTTGTTGVGTAYGRHTRVDRVSVDAGKLPTVAAANKAAATIGRRAQGRYRSGTLRSIPAPWLEGGDTVRVEMLGGAAETHQVATIRVPLPGLDVQVTETRDYAYTAS